MRLRKCASWFSHNPKKKKYQTWKLKRCAQSILNAWWMHRHTQQNKTKRTKNEHAKKEKKRKRRNRNINIEWIFLYHSDDKYVFVLVRLLYWEIILHFQVRTLHVYNKSSRHTRHNAEKKKIFIIHIERRQEERTPHISTQVKMKREKNEKMFFVRIHCDKRNIYMSCLLLNGYGLV